MRNGRSDKELFYKNYYPPANYDKVFEINQHTSEYYAIMVQKFGKAMADYYWNRRYSFERERDDYYINLCKEITEKCNKFLISRGINTRT